MSRDHGFAEFGGVVLQFDIVDTGLAHAHRLGIVTNHRNAHLACTEGQTVFTVDVGASETAALELHIDKGEKFASLGVGYGARNALGRNGNETDEADYEE